MCKSSNIRKLLERSNSILINKDKNCSGNAECYSFHYRDVSYIHQWVDDRGVGHSDLFLKTGQVVKLLNYDFDYIHGLIYGGSQDGSK